MSSHARPAHTLITPRLIIRSALPSDVKPFTTVRSDPLNNPHGGVHEPDLALEVQVERLEAQKASSAKGENAFMNIILKRNADIEMVDGLIVEDGILIGMTGFNSFPTSPSLSVPSKEVLVGDTGAMVDYRYGREGYALEALQAVIGYGFNELGCGMMSLDTFAFNAPQVAH